MQRRRDNVRIALHPRFVVPNNYPSIQRCIVCHKDIDEDYGQPSDFFEPIRMAHFCPCKSCVYCSVSCLHQDNSAYHRPRCEKILEIVSDIEQKITGLQDAHPRGRGVHTLFQQNFVDGLDFGFSLDKKEEVLYEMNDYFNARGNLIKELIKDNTARKNDLALDIAIVQCKDLLFLRRKDSELVLNYLYLLTGGLQDSYDLSCYFTRKGDVPLDDHELDPIVKDCVRHQNITKSYFKRGAKDGNFYINYQPCHWSAICQIYVVKYLLHMEMEKLISINKHFLDNQDCMVLIGEYAGMKKEWIVNDRNWYRDQAFEVFRLCHIEQFYFYRNKGPITSCFQQMKKIAAEFFPSETSRAIDTAIEAGTKWIGGMQLHQKQEENMSPSRWAAIIKNYESDHNLIYTIHIRPALPCAIRKVNTMAGYDAIGMNVDNNLGVTEFVTEVIKACNGRSESFYELFTFMAEGSYGEKDFDPYGNFQDNKCFSKAIKSCLLIEQKLAQCHFHKRKESDETKKILELLPGGIESYTPDPSEEDPVGPFLNLFKSYGCYIRGRQYNDIAFISKWLPAVTKVVDALFKAGLATNENLIVLFGRSGFVSYRVWGLQQNIEKHIEYPGRTQPSIYRLFPRKRIWKEGCIDNDKKLGLKMKYLNKIDRRQRFEDTRKQMPMGNFIQYLEPSLEQFVKKFGWNNLGISDDQYLFGSGLAVSGDVSEPVDVIEIHPKRHRRELDGYLTVEEACRHYFDTASLEEAIWDLVGIPRIIVLNGDQENMRKSGWRNCGNKSVLGDKAVQLGSRVAHVYSGWCTIWEEQEPLSEASSGSYMDSD